MNLKNLKSLYSDHDCQRIYVKKLSPNDNSKNQIYLGGSFEILNILPIQEIKNEPAGEWNKERFKAAIRFSWISDEGSIYPAPRSQLILYPKYPEVRFSGFLSGCEKPPSELMSQRLEGRLLFLSITRNGGILGYAAAPNSKIISEFDNLHLPDEHGVFKIIELPAIVNNRKKLLDELARIHHLGWITSKRLDGEGNTIPCIYPNCGGYTLEAELGIIPNASSEPDYLGWEIKQFGVRNITKTDSAVITLMTPEPTGGYYISAGFNSFIRKYGYKDLKGRSDRINFGGIHKVNKRHPRTGLQLELIGFDQATGKIRNTDGKIVLIDNDNTEVASWSFSSILLHWNRKHNQACYVPSQSEIIQERKYRYGNKVILGTGTDFQLFLSQMALGNIYYDPGIKMEHIVTKPTSKRRSQFRIKGKYLNCLYKTNEIVTLP